MTIVSFTQNLTVNDILDADSVIFLKSLAITLPR
jgi:hypothetical protein